MKQLRLALMVATIALAISGCSSESPEGKNTCPPGQSGCECSAGNVCDAGLTCSAAAVCVASTGSGGAASGGGPAASGGTSSGGTASGGATSGGSSSGGASSGGAAVGGSDTGGTSSGGNDTGAGGGSTDEFTLSSTELEEGAALLPKHTCEMNGFGNDESPPLAWTGVPEGTQSFALVFLDTFILDDDPNNSMGHHWAIWDIPGDITELPANLPACSMVTAPLSCEEFAPDIGNGGYLGPCPMGAAHTYEFRLYALPTATSSVGPNLNDAMLTALEEAALGVAVLGGTSSASPG